MKPFNLFFIFLCLLTANAAQGASLSDLQKMAIANREIIQRYQINLERSQEDEKVAKSGYYPSVDLSYNINHIQKPSLFEPRESSTLYGAVSWNLFNGFKDKYSIASSSFSRLAEQYKLQALQQDIQLNVALGYLDIFERRANLKVNIATHETLERMYADAQKRFEVGLIDKNDLLKFKVDLDHAVIAHKKAQADVDKALQRFSRQLDTPIAMSNLSFAEFNSLPKALDNPQATMLEKRSDLLAMRQAKEAAKLAIAAEKSRYLPRVDFTNSYQKYDDHNFAAGDYTPSEEIRSKLVFSINLFDGFKKSSQVKKARLQEKGVGMDIVELENDLKTELHNLQIDFTTSMENVTLAETSVEQSKENVRVSRLKYEEGLETEAGLLDAIANQARANYDLIATRTEVFANHFKLLRMVEGF